jgi:hypothetical protein
MKEQFKKDLLQLISRSNKEYLKEASIKALAQILAAESLADSIKELAKAIKER